MICNPKLDDLIVRQVQSRAQLQSSPRRSYAVSLAGHDDFGSNLEQTNIYLLLFIYVKPLNC